MRSLHYLSVFLFTTGAALAQNAVPLLYQTNPVSTKPRGDGFILTVSGTGFVSGAVVKWNNSSRQTTFVSSSQLQAAITAQDIEKASTASVTVVNAAGGASSNAIYFPIRTSSKTVTMKDGTHSILPGGIAVGDFNKDGNLDVIVDYARKGTGIYKGTLYAYLNNGNGTFKISQKIPHVDFATTMAVGDFNGDGNLDVVSTINYKLVSTLQMFWGDGKGTLGKAAPVDGGGYVLTPADLNGDGILDLATGDITGGDPYVGVGLGNGNGNFYGVDGNCEPPYGSQTAVGDFNGDGILDVAIASSWPPYLGKSVGVCLGNGDGTFGEAVVYDTPYLASGIAAVDLNGDGKLDLVTDGVAVLLGNGDGTFALGTSVEVGVAPAFQNVNIGDFNGDGKLDVAVVSVDQVWNGQQTIAILLGNGDGTFQAPIKFAGGVNPSEHFYGFFMGDFNNDGKLDLVLDQELSQGHTHLFLQH